MLHLDAAVLYHQQASGHGFGGGLVVADVELQYLYNDGSSYVFMDTATYEQLEVPNAQIDQEAKYLKENMIVNIISHNGETLGLDLPNTVDLEVVETEPGIRGDTATGGSKPAKMETGYIVSVPLFINEGEMLRIDTRTGAYIERVK